MSTLNFAVLQKAEKLKITLEELIQDQTSRDGTSIIIGVQMPSPATNENIGCWTSWCCELGFSLDDIRISHNRYDSLSQYIHIESLYAAFREQFANYPEVAIDKPQLVIMDKDVKIRTTNRLVTVPMSAPAAVSFLAKINAYFPRPWKELKAWIEKGKEGNGSRLFCQLEPNRKSGFYNNPNEKFRILPSMTGKIVCAYIPRSDRYIPLIRIDSYDKEQVQLAFDMAVRITIQKK